MEPIDKILQVVLETQSDVKELNIRVNHLEEVQENTYTKLDGFLVLINRYESEISALRSAYERLTDRVARLEVQRA